MIFGIPNARPQFWTSYSSVFAQKSVARPTSVRVRASARLSMGEKKCIDRAFPPGSHRDRPPPPHLEYEQLCASFSIAEWGQNRKMDGWRDGCMDFAQNFCKNPPPSLTDFRQISEFLHEDIAGFCCVKTLAPPFRSVV